MRVRAEWQHTRAKETDVITRAQNNNRLLTTSDRTQPKYHTHIARTFEQTTTKKRKRREKRRKEEVKIRRKKWKHTQRVSAHTESKHRTIYSLYLFRFFNVQRSLSRPFSERRFHQIFVGFDGYFDRMFSFRFTSICCDVYFMCRTFIH